MKLPTIVYETVVTPQINQGKQCILCARMQDVEDLSNKMLYAARNPEIMDEMANNGYQYAIENYSNRKVAKRLVNAAISVMEKERVGKAIPEEFYYEP